MTNTPTTIPGMLLSKWMCVSYATGFWKCNVYYYLLARHYNYAIVPFTLAIHTHLLPLPCSSFFWSVRGCAIAIFSLFAFLFLHIDFVCLFLSYFFMFGVHSLRTIVYWMCKWKNGASDIFCMCKKHSSFFLSCQKKRQVTIKIDERNNENNKKTHRKNSTTAMHKRMQTFFFCSNKKKRIIRKKNNKKNNASKWINFLFECERFDSIECAH